MSNRLPDSWAKQNFGELNQFCSQTIDPSAQPDTEFELYSVPSFPTRKPEIVSGRDIGSTKQVLEPDDLLVCKINPRINRVWQVAKQGNRLQIGSSEWIGFRAKDLDTRYFRYYFSSPEFRELICKDVTGVGGSLTRAQPKNVASFPLPVAPLSEQKRIADKLDSVLPRVNACSNSLDRTALLLKRFRQATLAAATSGRLTEDWRAKKFDDATKVPASKSPLVIFESDQDALASNWHWQRLTTLAKLESGHTPRKSVPEYWENGTIPWISLQDIRAADGTEIFETKYKPTELGIANSSARLLPKGTVCFCRDISFGYVTIMGREMSTTQHFANWVCGEQLIPKYLMYSFMAARDFLAMSGQGTTVTTIYMPALKELRLATPPFAEQTEIVRRVELLFAFADRLEARLANARRQVGQLTPALLAKAFRGKLVAQDPDDEPAAELLKRLAESRAPKEKVKRRKMAGLSAK